MTRWASEENNFPIKTKKQVIQKKSNTTKTMQSEELWRLEALLGDPNLLRRPKEDLILVLDRLIDRHDQSGPETDNFYRLLAELIELLPVSWTAG